jgi:hypothetical protein
MLPRDVRVTRIDERASEIQGLVIARNLRLAGWRSACAAPGTDIIGPRICLRCRPCRYAVAWIVRLVTGTARRMPSADARGAGDCGDPPPASLCGTQIPQEQRYFNQPATHGG